MRKRAPLNIPTKEDQRVRLRGRDVEGMVTYIGENGWTLVNWDKPKSAPMWCHQNELEVV